MDQIYYVRPETLKPLGKNTGYTPYNTHIPTHTLQTFSLGLSKLAFGCPRKSCQQLTNVILWNLKASV